MQVTKLKFLYYGSFGTFNTETWIAYGLRELGHEVVEIDKTTHGCVAVEQALRQEKPHVLLFAKVPTEFDKTITLAKGMGIKTVCWLFDLYHGWRNLNVPQFKADLVFTTDGGNDKEWKRLGINHITLRQGIHEPEHIMYEAKQKYKVAFIGSAHYPERIKLLQFLKETYGSDFHHFGQNGELRNLDLNERLAETSVIVGDSVPSRGYWSNRVYEITGRGGFLIHPFVEGLRQEFDSIPYFEYGNYKDLKYKIDHYLEDDFTRELLRVAQFKECEKYTYTKRCKELCRHILS